MLGLNLKKIRKAEIFLHGFIGIVNESKRKPNKSWVGQRKQFHNSFMQKWLDDNGILMHSMHNEVNSAVVVAVPPLFKLVSKWIQ